MSSDKKSTPAGSAIRHFVFGDPPPSVASKATTKSYASPKTKLKKGTLGYKLMTAAAASTKEDKSGQTPSMYEFGTGRSSKSKEGGDSKRKAGASSKASTGAEQ